MTVVLFLISLAALQRSPGPRSILLSLALGLFSLKNLTLTYFYLVDDLPDIRPLMFADTLVTGAILLRLLISGTMGKGSGSDTEPDTGFSPGSDPRSEQCPGPASGPDKDEKTTQSSAPDVTTQAPAHDAATQRPSASEEPPGEPPGD